MSGVNDMSEGAKSLYGSIIGMGGTSGGGGGGGANTFKVYFGTGQWSYNWEPSSSTPYMELAYDDNMTFGQFISSSYNPWAIIDWDHYYPYAENQVTEYAFESPNNSNVYYNFRNSQGSEDYESVYLRTGSLGTSHIVQASETISSNTDYYIFLENAEEGSDCFVAGSKVLLPNNLTKNIEDVKVGDAVATLDPETLELSTATVQDVKNSVEKIYSHKWYRFKFDDGSEVHLTGRHRFFNVDTQKFEWMQDFKVGERVYKIDGTMPAFVSVETIEEKVEYNTFWNVNRDNYFVDGFLSGNLTTPIPNIKVAK